MNSVEHERELIFVKLIRKGPHILEFSDDYLMVHNGKFTLATSTILEQYNTAKNTLSIERKHELMREIAGLIDTEYYRNKNLEWYSLREYIGNFEVNRLEELKGKLNQN